MSDWFESWAINHATIFGLSEDAEISAIMAWREALGATDEELADATRYLSQNLEALTVPKDMPYPGKMTVHLMALRKRILWERAKRYEVEKPTWEDKYGTCARCSSSGFVIVPHLKFVKDGVWIPQIGGAGEEIFHTFAVQCHCALGNWARDHTKQKSMTLESYQASNPGWAEQLNSRKKQERAMSTAVEQNKRLVSTLGIGKMPEKGI